VKTKIVFLVSGLTSYLVMFITFLDAYLHYSKSTLVTINTYGEANLELGLFIVSLPFVLLGSKDYLEYIIENIQLKENKKDVK